MKLPRTECDGCGRSMAKAKRVYKGEGFCGACYARDFYVVPCVDCGANARVFGKVGYGRCRKCEQQTRRCVRCDRLAPRVALTVAAGVVCTRCRRHFEPFPKPQPKVMGNRTCAGCHKYRPVAFRDENERPFCEACRNPAHIEKAREKDRLYWTERVRKAAEISSHGLEGCEWQVLFRDMVIAYGETKSIPVLLRRIPGYLGFVQQLESLARTPGELRAVAMLEQMTAADLRRHERVLTYLHGRGFEVPTRAAAEDASNRRRIRDALAELSGNRHRGSVASFAAAQAQPSENRPNKGWPTIRLNVRAAVELSKFLAERVFSTRGIEQFLEATPGHRACLYAFVTFLRPTHPEIRILPRSVPDPVKVPPPITAGVLDRFVKASDFPDARAGFLGVLVAFIGMPLKVLCVLPFAALAAPTDDQYLMTLEGRTVALPTTISRAVGRYAELRAAYLGGAESPHLFPGRPGHQPVTTVSITIRLRAWGIKPGAVALSARRAIVTAAESM